MNAIAEYQEKYLCTSDDQLRISLAEFDVSEKELQEYIDRIWDWYNLQPHLPKDGFDIEYVKRLLILNKFNMDKTKKTVDNIISGRTIIPDILGNIDPLSKNIERALKIVDFSVMPKLTENNERVSIWRLNTENPDLWETTSVVASAFMIIDMRLRMDTNTRDKILFDFTNLRLIHFLMTSPTVMKNSVHAFEKCYGRRYAALYILNCPSYVAASLNLVISAMKPKLAKTVVFLKDINHLHQYIEKKNLPLDYDGTYPRYSKDIAEEWKEAMRSPLWKEWFDKAFQFRSDESKRLGKADLMMDDMLGVSGTFRSLNLD